MEIIILAITSLSRRCNYSASYPYSTSPGPTTAGSTTNVVIIANLEQRNALATEPKGQLPKVSCTKIPISNVMCVYQPVLVVHV